MFYYISFLRPPPESSQRVTPISLTPHIANDLRTELFEAPQDIFYSWSLVPSSKAQDTSATIPSIPKPTKLTSYRSENAYREILVPLPTNVREGQAYRLVLTSRDQGHPHVINLVASNCGERPFPVMSMPIIFRTINGGNSKQDQVERVYRIATPQHGQCFFKIKEQTSFDLDKKVWDSGIGLSSWITTAIMEENPSNPEESSLRRLLLSHGELNIIELGCGTGIVSIVLGAIRARETSGGGRIIATDVASAMPLLQDNISANSHLFSGPCQPEAAILDWGEELPRDVKSINGGLGLIVMADVTYNTSSFPILVRTLSSLLALREAGSSKGPLILMGYKERDPAERTLWDLAMEAGITFDRIGERAGAGGAPVEIWLGRCVK